MILITWSMVLKVIQLVKQILKKINELNEIRKVEIKGKWLTENQKKLLSLFDDLKAIFNVNESKSESENESESVNESVNENENESVNENDDDNDNDNDNDIENENESVNDNENDNDNDSENESESENENKSDDEQYYKIKQINNIFKMIDKKWFKDQIGILKKIEWLNDYWYTEYYEDNKEINLKI